MRKRVILLAGALLLVFSGKGFSQNTAPKIGVMNVLRAIVECQEGKLANENFQKKYEARRDELSKKQKELEDLQQQAKSQASTLAEQARAALARNIESKTTELQRAQEDAEKEFTQLRNEIFNGIGAKLAPLVQQYSKEHGFTLVLDSSAQTSQLSYIDPATDITDDVIKRFDATHVSSGSPPAGLKPSPSAPQKAPAPVKPPATAAKAPAAPAKKN